ncbi:MAG: YqaE/Pmp3 family membrane protein [Daejeonella sp.]|uniref:YqaE/Pmp3 family membrane protein n=1 Tax=Daejeonella sp. JGW-45 TaxID=3034148 RepID=UPI0023EB3E62|nr:YqaE/Pmp3 family membrane protein [Daejeonella sp. JGW-45]
MILIAILFPSLSFFLRGKIFSALLCLILQLTLIGWLPAALWAVVSRSNAVRDEKLREMEKRILANQKTR